MGNEASRLEEERELRNKLLSLDSEDFYKARQRRGSRIAPSSSFAPQLRFVHTMLICCPCGAQFDVDGDLRVDPDELQKGLATAGIEVTHDKCLELINAADVDGDGCVSFEVGHFLE